MMRGSISGEGKRDANGEEGSQEKVLDIVDGGFKDYPTIIPNNNFTKSWEKL